MSKTIAFFLSDLQNGGTEWFAIHLARSLKAKGYKPHFLLARMSGDLLPQIRDEFPVTDLKGGSYSPCGILRCLPALVRFLKNTPPDVLIGGLPLINATAGIAKLFTQAKTRLIVVEHVRLRAATDSFCCTKHWAKALLVSATHWLADEFVCVSRTVARDIQCLWFTRKVVEPNIIYNPVIPANIDVLCAEPVDHPWIAEATTHDGPLILSIGRLLGNKDYPTLLTAFELVLLHNTPTARLLILGEGEERSRLEALIRVRRLEDHVSLPGAVPNIFPYLKAASLFVLPSRSEAFGNVIVEALACGTPVVSTDCGGPREILQDGRYGRLVSVGRADEMAQAMLATLAERTDKAALILHGMSFSVAKSTDAYLKIIEGESGTHQTDL